MRYLSYEITLHRHAQVKSIYENTLKKNPPPDIFYYDYRRSPESLLNEIKTLETEIAAYEQKYQLSFCDL